MVEYAHDFENGVNEANVQRADVAPASIASINAGLTYRSSSALFGSLGVLFNGNGYYPWISVAVGTSPAVTYLRFYVRFRSVSTNYMNLAYMTNSITIGLNNNRTLVLRQAGVKATSTAISLNEWIRIEWTHDYTNLFDTVNLFTGSNVHGSTPSQTLSSALVTAAYNSAKVGVDSVGVGILYDVDALAVSTTAMPVKIAPPSLPGNADMFLWDGTSMVAVDAFAWDGTTMVAADPSV